MKRTVNMRHFITTYLLAALVEIMDLIFVRNFLSNEVTFETRMCSQLYCKPFHLMRNCLPVPESKLRMRLFHDYAVVVVTVSFRLAAPPQECVRLE
jgi:hypothetical protein